MVAVIADRVSLSPNLISLTEMVSFSLTMGTTPRLSSSLKVLTAFRYRVLYYNERVHIFYFGNLLTSDISPRVKRI